MSRLEFWYHLPVTQSVNYVFESALKTAELGFDAVSHQDHFFYVHDERGTVPECLTMFTAVAMRTRLKVSPLVLCSMVRNPALLAKIFATMDQLTKGRVYLAVGACWWREELKGYGYRWEPPKTRVDMTLEVIKIVKKLWTEDTVNYDGKFWKIRNCRLVPKPYQKPHPPILSGGEGRRMLRIAARHCDGWIGVTNSLEEYKEKMNYIKGWLADPESFIFGNVFQIYADRDSVEDVVKRVEKFVDLGVSRIIFFIHPQPRNLEMLDTYAKVIDYFR